MNLNKKSTIFKTIIAVAGLALITACNPVGDISNALSNNDSSSNSSSVVESPTPTNNKPDSEDTKSSENPDSSESETDKTKNESESSDETDKSDNSKTSENSSETSESPTESSLEPPAPDPNQVNAEKTGTARSVLNTLEVKPADESIQYNREEYFGSAWTDKNTALWGGNKCDTRNDILKRDLKTYVFREGDNCIIESGVLNDPYTAKEIDFVRGVSTSSKIQIDHQVALKDAWITGAMYLTQDQRVNLANDPLNLAAVDGPTNQSKGSKDASEWLPSNEGVQCQYVSLQIAVKAKYNLWVTKNEKESMNDVLNSCPNYPVATEPGGYSSK